MTRFSRLQRWVIGATATLVAIRVFFPVQFLNLRGIRYPYSYWPGIRIHPSETRYATTDVPATLFHVIGIVILAGIVLWLISQRDRRPSQASELNQATDEPSRHSTVSSESGANEYIFEDLDREFAPNPDNNVGPEAEEEKKAYREYMKSIGEEDYIRKSDQFAREFPWVRYADAPQPTPEEYERALKRGVQIFGREMKEIKTPRDYEYEEEALLSALSEHLEDFRKAHNGKTPKDIDDEYRDRFPELKELDRAAFVAAVEEKYKQEHGGMPQAEVVEEYKRTHPEQFAKE